MLGNKTDYMNVYVLRFVLDSEGSSYYISDSPKAYFLNPIHEDVYQNVQELLHDPKKVTQSEFNLFKSNGISHSFELDKSISILRVAV